MNAIDIAEVCHEVNRALCLAFGDDSHASWENAPEWQKESILRGVEMHLEHVRSPEESHEAWCAHKIEEGWTWGPTKDVSAKKHPCLVAYKDLPPEQRAKDYIVATIVDKLKKFVSE